MNEVSAHMCKAVLDLASSIGVDHVELVRGLSFDRAALDIRTRVGWDDYTTLIERFELACGGPDALDAVLATGYARAFDPRLAKLARSLSPRWLYLMDPFFPSASNVERRVEELADGRLFSSYRLLHGYRPCLTFFRGTIVVERGMSLYGGLPPATSEVLEVHERGLSTLVTLPEADFEATVSVAQLTTMLRQFAWTMLRLTPAELGSLVPDEPPSLHAAATQVAEALLALGWDDVTVHSGGQAPPARARSGVTSARRPMSAGTSVFDLVLEGSGVALLELHGDGDLAALERRARTFAAYLRAEAIVAAYYRSAQLQPAGLSRREHDTWRLLVRGLSEKEIAASLGVSQHTVHNYVKRIYDAQQVRSRAELLGRLVAL